MIRQDYILRMIEELQRVLASIAALKEERRWQEITGTVDEQFTQLLEVDAAEAARLSDTDLMARLVHGETTRFVREKTQFLITLFKEAGDAAVAQDQAEQGRAFYLKGLHLLLGAVPGEDSFESPDFVPGLEAFLAALADAPLPARTQAMLMRYYEQRGAFAKAEDVLFDLLDAEPGNSEVLDFGMAFYERLRGQSDSALANGNLPRPELEAGLAELFQRQAGSV
jgi:hypothetical protein